MRYLLQFLIPALIFVAVVYVLSRGRRSEPDEPGEPRRGSSDTAAFIVILAVSAVVALGTAYVLVLLWE